MLIIACFILTACRENNKNEERVKFLKTIVEDNLGKKLILPDSIHVYKPFSNYLADSAKMFNSEYKIYVHIDASCGTCISKIGLWNKLIPEFSKHKVPVILICGAIDRFELLKYLCENDKIKKFPYPFILDTNNKFLQLNEFMEVNDFRTVLTDKYNNILLLGNPIRSKTMKGLFLKQIIND